MKSLLNGYGGKVFSSRNKLGFGLPMAAFMRSKDFPLWSILENNDPVYEFVDEVAIIKMRAAHLAGKEDWNMQLWSILVLSNWLKKKFN